MDLRASESEEIEDWMNGIELVISMAYLSF